VHRLAHRFEEPGLGAIMFMLPATGSTITQAMALPAGEGIAQTCSRRCSPSTIVCCARSGRHARPKGIAEGQHAAAGLDQQAVAVAVVAALELHDRRAR
jgi:hypothetical protein